MNTDVVNNVHGQQTGIVSNVKVNGSSMLNRPYIMASAYWMDADGMLKDAQQIQIPDPDKVVEWVERKLALPIPPDSIVISHFKKRETSHD